MWGPLCHSVSQCWIHGSFVKRAMTHDPFLKHHNKNNAQFNKTAMTNAEEILLSSTSMTNQAIRLFLNLSYKVLQQWVMPETGNRICPSNVLTDTTSSSNQAPLSVPWSLALKSLFLMSRHVPSFVWAIQVAAEHPSTGGEEGRIKLRGFFVQPAHN